MLSFGQLFGSNFWSSFKCQPSESIEKLLAKDDCRIEELLNDTDLLQECKNSNKNLIKYLDREKIKELIDFITVMPDEDEHDRGHKFPFIANEVFNCDIQEVINKFFIAPSEDVQDDSEQEEPAEDEDSTKFESGFEKDNENSSDSEEENFTKDHEDDSPEDQDTSDNTKVEEIHDEEPTDKKAEEADKPEEAEGEDKKEKEPVEFDVSDKTVEKKLDTPEETTEDKNSTEEAKAVKKDEEASSPSTEEPKKEEAKEETPEETKADSQNPASASSSQVAASPPTENSKSEVKGSEEAKQSEETPETEGKDATKAAEPTQASEEQIEEQPTADSTIDDASTHVSDATSEATVPKEQKPALSTNKYDLLDYLTGFIDTDEELNDVLAGYFARLCNILLQKKSDEMAKYFYTKDHLLYRFAYHSYSKSLTDTVIKILDINTDKLDLDESEVIRVRQTFINKLLERLGDDKSEVSYEYSLNVFQIFNELTFKKSFYTILIDKDVLETLGDILKRSSPECSSNAAIRILNVLISHLRDYLANTSPQGNLPSYMDDNDEVTIQDDENSNANAGPTLEEQISKHQLVEYFKDHVIEFLVKQLEILPERTHIDFQYADNQFVLGKKRLACINLMESLVELDDLPIRDKIMETNFYEQLFDLFLAHRYNTFLHLHLDNIFHRILRDQNASTEYKVNFVKKLHIFEKLPPFWSDNQMLVFPSQREFRHGYLAFTTRMANTIRDISKNTPEFAELTGSEEWKNFVQNDVEVYNEKNSIVLANRGGNRKDSDDFEGLEDEDDQRFKDLDEREDLDDKDDDDEDDDDDDYSANRNSMRETLQAYDPSKARDEHENMFVGDNIEKDEDEDNLFSGLHGKQKDDDSDDDHPIGGDYDSSDSDSENEREDVSENSGYYNNSYWQINQYSIEDLLH